MSLPSSSSAAVVKGPLWAQRVARALSASGVDDVVYVPDNPLSHILAALAANGPQVRQTLATREEEAVGIAAGLYLGGRRPAILMQSSGLGNCANAVGSLLAAYQIPVVLVLSMRGDPGEWNWAQVPFGRAVGPILDALGIPRLSIDNTDDAEERVRAICGTAFGTRFPGACLLARRLTSAETDARPLVKGEGFRNAAVVAGDSAPWRRTDVEAAAMTRAQATTCLAASFRDHAVVVSLGHPAYDLFTACDRPGNFYTWGSMGTTSSIALGVALARPDRRVVALDGDGALLMNLGSLATIGACQPSNLVVVVWDNEQYGTTGGQPTPTARSADLAAAARAMGLHAVTVTTPATLADAFVDAERERRATVIVAKVRESAPTGKPPLDCVSIKQRFMLALGTPEPGTLGTAVL